MKLISLFSGIGGFELAAEWMGWENIVSCEINPFGRKVLEHYWPKAYHHDDIKTLTYEKINEELTARFGADWRSDDIILTGGFPCQPYSSAGKRLGKEDERHLWPEMLRIIRETQPRWIVGENVLGLVNWSGGLVFHEVQADLEAQGYEVQPYVLPAASVNAPHRRDRVWFVAYANGNSIQPNKHGSIRCSDGENKVKTRKTFYNAFGSNGNTKSSSHTDSLRQHQCECRDEEQSSQGWVNALGDIEQSNANGVVADTESKSSERLQSEQREFGKKKQRKFRGINRKIRGRDAADTCSRRVQRYWGKSKRQQIQTTEFDKNNSEFNRPMGWEKFPTQSPVCSGDDGFSAKLDGITFPKWRNESIKAAGNAIVPQVVYQIFKTIKSYENQ